MKTVGSIRLQDKRLVFDLAGADLTGADLTEADLHDLGADMAAELCVDCGRPEREHTPAGSEYMPTLTGTHDYRQERSRPTQDAHRIDRHGHENSARHGF